MFFGQDRINFTEAYMHNHDEIRFFITIEPLREGRAGRCKLAEMTIRRLQEGPGSPGDRTVTIEKEIGIVFELLRVLNDDISTFDDLFEGLHNSDGGFTITSQKPWVGLQPDFEECPACYKPVGVCGDQQCADDMTPENDPADIPKISVSTLIAIGFEENFALMIINDPNGNHEVPDRDAACAAVQAGLIHRGDPLCRGPRSWITRDYRTLYVRDYPQSTEWVHAVGPTMIGIFDTRLEAVDAYDAYGDMVTVCSIGADGEKSQSEVNKSEIMCMNMDMFEYL